MADPETPRRLIAGNWKMNHQGLLGVALRLAGELKDLPANVEVAVWRAATLIYSVAQAIGASGIVVGGQDCRPEPAGAFTGDVSAEMLKDAGAAAVILGHSERRHGHGESDELIRRKVEAA